MRKKNSYFDWTIYKKTVTRFWPLWTAYFTFWLIALPLDGVMELRRQAESTADYNYMARFANLHVPDSVSAALYLALIFGGLAAMAVFSHLYNPRSANFFGTLPVRREGMFLTHYLAGLSFLLIPNLAIFLLTLLVEAMGGCVVMEALLFWLGAACGECFFFYTLAVFCAMFTGHILAMPAFYGIVNILAAGVMMLVRTMLMEFYYGFAGISDNIGDVITWLTPVMKLEHGVYTTWNYIVTITDGVVTQSDERVLTLEGLNIVGIYALAGAVLAVCAFLLYRVRRLESAGDVVAVAPMRPVFKFGVAICAGMLLGVGTCSVLSGGEGMLMVCILIWAVIGYFAAQMLLDKSFRVFKKWKGAAAVAAVYAAVFVVVGFDLTGFETRVPDPSTVDWVWVNGLSAVTMEDSGDYVTALMVTDPTQVQQLIDLHQAVVDDRDRDEAGTNFMCRMELEYKLTDGSTLSREYWIHVYLDEVKQEGSTAWAVEQLYGNRDFYWDAYGFPWMEEQIAQGGRLESATLLHYYDKDGGQTSFVVGYGADAQALLDAVREDFFAGRIGVRTLNKPDGYYRDYTFYENGVAVESKMADTALLPDTLTFRVVDNELGDTLARVEIALQETSSATLDALERALNTLDSPDNRQSLEDCLSRLGR